LITYWTIAGKRLPVCGQV